MLCICGCECVQAHVRRESDRRTRWGSIARVRLWDVERQRRRTSEVDAKHWRPRRRQFRREHVDRVEDLLIFLVLFWYRLVELSLVVLVVQLGFMLVFALAIEDDVVLRDRVLARATQEGKKGQSRRTCSMSIFVARWLAAMLLKNVPTSPLLERRRLGENTVDKESTVIWLLSS